MKCWNSWSAKQWAPWEPGGGNGSSWGRPGMGPERRYLVLASEELGGIIRPEEGCAKWSAQQTRRQGGVMLPVYPGDWGLCGELTRCMVSRI